jgi:hypothetical protein
MVITLSHLNGDDPYSKYANMLHRYCNDPSMEGGDHAFSWSRKRLLKVFKSSGCFKPDDRKLFLHFSGGGYRYQRRIAD